MIGASILGLPLFLCPRLQLAEEVNSPLDYCTPVEYEILRAAA